VSPDDSSRIVTAEGVHRTDPAEHSAATSNAIDIEAALVAALSRAAEAGRFDVVAQLARELEARRLARAGNVVRFDERERGTR